MSESNKDKPKKSTHPLWPSAEIASMMASWDKQAKDMARFAEAIKTNSILASASITSWLKPLESPKFDETKLTTTYQIMREKLAKQDARMEADRIAEEKAKGRIGFRSKDEEAG